jgi:hypothetical protein
LTRYIGKPRVRIRKSKQRSSIKSPSQRPPKNSQNSQRFSPSSLPQKALNNLGIPLNTLQSLSLTPSETNLSPTDLSLLITSKLLHPSTLPQVPLQTLLKYIFNNPKSIATLPEYLRSKFNKISSALSPLSKAYKDIKNKHLRDKFKGQDMIKIDEVSYLCN